MQNIIVTLRISLYKVTVISLYE